MTKSIWTALALVLAALGPVACGDEAPPAETGPAIAGSNARLMLPAVAGNPGAVYFDVANSGTKDMMISGARVDGSQNTIMHITEPTGMQEILQIMVKAGETVKFEEGGNHLMAMDLPDTLEAGDTANVTLHFVGGDEVTFPAEVHAAGDR